MAHERNGGEGKLKMPRMDTNGICMHLAGFLKSARTKNRSTMTILVPTEQFVSFDPALNFWSLSWANSLSKDQPVAHFSSWHYLLIQKISKDTETQLFDILLNLRGNGADSYVLRFPLCAGCSYRSFSRLGLWSWMRSAPYLLQTLVSFRTWCRNGMKRIETDKNSDMVTPSTEWFRHLAL